MTPKEKAIELVAKFAPYMYCYMGSGMLSNDDYDEKVVLTFAKSCALIAVDEIINSNPLSPYNGGYYELASDRMDEVKEYWEIVKKEIEQL